MSRKQGDARCSVTGDYTRTYAFFSDQAIRENQVIEDFVRSGRTV